MKAYERLIKYAKINTASDAGTGTSPSTERQFRLAEVLAEEMRALGMSDVEADGFGYVYGNLPAAPGYGGAPRLGLLAHMDTSPDFSGENVQPQVIGNYDGGDVALGTSGRTLTAKMFPHLPSLRGRTLITTDGTTLLGADDKAGAAEILTLVEALQASGEPHGKVAVCFTPDEEIGGGTAHIDLDKFGADLAYTVDGGPEGEIVYENFNACEAVFVVNGVSVHPGSAKGLMVNAALVATEINAMLPSGDTPRGTEGYEGFYHMTGIAGTVEKAKLTYIVRDHDAAKFDMRIETLRHIEKLLNEKYGAGTVTLAVREQYRNMAEKIRPDHFCIVEYASEAIRAAGVEPIVEPIRGGTDGARLSWMGLPCPNLGTGGYAFHGPYEHTTAEGMDKCVDILLGIVRLCAK